MSDAKAEQAVVIALLERMSTQRIPRALELKAKVDGGERLDDQDIAFLEEVMQDVGSVRTVLAPHPELHELAMKAVNLYHAITARALENEKAAG